MGAVALFIGCCGCAQAKFKKIFIAIPFGLLSFIVFILFIVFGAAALGVSLVSDKALDSFCLQKVNANGFRTLPEQYKAFEPITKVVSEVDTWSKVPNKLMCTSKCYCKKEEELKFFNVKTNTESNVARNAAIAKNYAGNSNYYQFTSNTNEKRYSNFEDCYKANPLDVSKVPDSEKAKTKAMLAV